MDQVNEDTRLMVDIKYENNKQQLQECKAESKEFRKELLANHKGLETETRGRLEKFEDETRIRIDKCKDEISTKLEKFEIEIRNSISNFDSRLCIQNANIEKKSERYSMILSFIICFSSAIVGGLITLLVSKLLG